MDHRSKEIIETWRWLSYKCRKSIAVEEVQKEDIIMSRCRAPFYPVSVNIKVGPVRISYWASADFVWYLN